MLTKRCSKCGIEKGLDEFYSNKRAKDGKQSYCKDCKKECYKQWCEGHLEEIKEYQKQWYKDHSEEIKKHKKQYYKDNLEEINEYHKQWYKDNSEEIKERSKQYCKAHPKEYKQWHKDHSEELKEYKKQWYKDNLEEIKERSKQYQQSDNGKTSIAKCNARRKRELGYITLNKRFEGCHGHHVDLNHVVFIPAEMHINNPHSLKNPSSMITINRLAFDFLENGEKPKDTPTDPKIMLESESFPKKGSRKIIPLSKFFKTNPT